MLKLLSCFSFLVFLSLKAIFICQAGPIVDAVFSNTPPLATPCPGTHTYSDNAVTPVSWSWNRCARSDACVSQTPPPSPIRVQVSFSISKRRISPGCVLLQPPCTPSLSVLETWIWASPHCLPLKPSVSSAPESLHCPDRLPETGSLFSGRELCP